MNRKAVDRFESELKPLYKKESDFWDDYFKSRYEYEQDG